jgi:hypothetical protein
MGNKFEPQIHQFARKVLETYFYCIKDFQFFTNTLL